MVDSARRKGSAWQATEALKLVRMLLNRAMDERRSVGMSRRGSIRRRRSARRCECCRRSSWRPRRRTPRAVEGVRRARGLLVGPVVGARSGEAGRPRHRGTDAPRRREARGGPRPVRVGRSEDGGVGARHRPAAARDPVGGRAPAPVPAAPRTMILGARASSSTASIADLFAGTSSGRSGSEPAGPRGSRASARVAPAHRCVPRLPGDEGPEGRSPNASATPRPG